MENGVELFTKIIRYGLFITHCIYHRYFKIKKYIKYSLPYVFLGIELPNVFDLYFNPKYVNCLKTTQHDIYVISPIVDTVGVYRVIYIKIAKKQNNLQYNAINKFMICDYEHNAIKEIIIRRHFKDKGELLNLFKHYGYLVYDDNI